MDSNVSPDFAWRGSPAGRVLVSTALDAIAPHAFSTRDISPDGARSVDPDRVGAIFDLPGRQVVSVRQVHGRVVALVRPGEPFTPDALEADAIVSTDPARVVLVRVADCVPILLADTRRRAVAAVHAGWRGTAAGIIGATVDVLVRAGIDPADVVAAIGPSIGVCCYEVDRPVHEAFLRAHGEAAGAWFVPVGPERYRLDLRRANRDQLIHAGVLAGAVHGAAACTFEGVADWHSHRRDQQRAGRMAAAIRLDATGL